MVDRNQVKIKAVELVYAARTVIQQLSLRDGSPEGVAAGNLLIDALSNAIPNVCADCELEETRRNCGDAKCPSKIQTAA